MTSELNPLHDDLPRAVRMLRSLYGQGNGYHHLAGLTRLELSADEMRDFLIAGTSDRQVRWLGELLFEKRRPECPECRKPVDRGEGFAMIDDGLGGTLMVHVDCAGDNDEG